METPNNETNSPNTKLNNGELSRNLDLIASLILKAIEHQSNSQLEQKGA